MAECIYKDQRMNLGICPKCKINLRAKYRYYCTQCTKKEKSNDKSFSTV